jgi:DNA polymerase-1
MDHLRKAKAEVEESIRRLKANLLSSDVYQSQRKMFGDKAKITSRQQLAKVLEKDYKATIPKTESGKNYNLDELVLQAVASKHDVQYCRDFMEHESLVKLNGTYLDGVIREVVDGYLHVIFNLHLARTHRSSCDSPNLQNVPIRDPLIAKYIRTAFIPRPGHALVEIDFSALEFRICACFYRDPAMVQYASDPDKDIHRDCAAKIFKANRDDITKQDRFCAKNLFVFPELYGDFYLQCAQNLWDAMSRHSLTIQNTPAKEWLSNNGVTRLGECDSKKKPVPGTFEHHMKKFEDEFYQWFPVLDERRDKFWAEYKKTGQFDLMTGFVIRGVFKRNFVLNCIIQGPAFHLLLWSLIQIVRWTQKHKTKTKVVAQIHDSILADVHLSELDEYMEFAVKVMTQMVKEHYRWVITPLNVEAEIGRLNWYEKEKLAI